MKKITAFLFAVMVVFILAGCSTQAAQSEKEKQNGNGEGNTNENNEVSKDVVYRTLYSGDGRIWLESITFKEDGTFVFHSKGFVKYSFKRDCIKDGEDWHKYECDEDLYWGSYTGEASKNGEICLTLEKMRNDNGEIVDYNKDNAVIKTTVNNLRFTIYDTEYISCGFYTVNPFYETSYNEEIIRLTFRPDGIVEVEDIYKGESFKYECYYTGKAGEDGFLNYFEYNEEEIHDESEIKLMIIRDKKLYFCFINEDGTVEVDSTGFIFIRKN